MASKAQVKKRLHEQRMKADRSKAAAREQRTFELRTGVNAAVRRQSSAEWRAEYMAKLREDITPMGEVSRESIGGLAPQRSVMNSLWKKPLDDPEMARREALAQERIAQRNKQVAPAFNKGAYQLITDLEAYHVAGRKV
jgi:phage protein D